MAEMTYKNIDLIKLMPEFMKSDEAVKALSDTISRMLVEALGEADAQTVYGNEDSLSEPQCDELAWEWDIDWYDYNLSLQEKRATIKTAANVKRKRGTKGAVVEFLRSVYGSGELLEWYEYGGQPYHFKLRTDETRTPETEAIFTKRINQIKNARSVLDAVETRRQVTGNVYGIAAACIAKRTPAIIDGHRKENEERGETQAAMALTMQRKTPAIIDAGTWTRKEEGVTVAKTARVESRRRTVVGG